jgi:hypothetical protein
MKIVKNNIQKMALGLCLTAMTIGVSKAQLLNGSFETGAAALNYDLDPGPGVVDIGLANFQLPTSWSFANIVGGSTPWTSKSGAFNGDTNGYFGPAQDGGFYAAIQTDSSQGAAQGAIFQTMTGLTIGQTYQVTGFVRARDTASQTGVFSVSTSLGGTMTSGSPTSDTLWTAFSGTFTATTTSDNINLVWSHAVNTDQTVLFDNITVTAIPEPSSIALVGVGLVALFFMRRRSLAS